MSHDHLPRHRCLLLPRGGNSFTINTMVNDGLPQEAELTDTYVEVRILDQVTQTATA